MCKNTDKISNIGVEEFHTLHASSVQIFIYPAQKKNPFKNQGYFNQ
jgi:hypothetical protein